MMEPETSLPWDKIEASHIFYVNEEDGVRYLDSASCKDRDFMVHACNAYPKLVENLKSSATGCGDTGCAFNAQELLKELGELDAEGGK